MERNLLKTSAAISELNKGKTLGYDTTDGVAYIRKKSNQIYEMLIKSNGDEAEPVFEGNFKALMKTLNGSLNNKCYIVNDSIRF